MKEHFTSIGRTAFFLLLFSLFGFEQPLFSQYSILPQLPGLEEPGVGDLALLGGCIDPLISGVQKSDDPCMPGLPVTLTVSGDLNDATNWRWYDGSCGGNPVGTGAFVIVNPLVTTTYYVRGEPGCVTDLPCSEVTVNVGSDGTPPNLIIPADVTVECGENTVPPAQQCGPVPIARESLVAVLPPSGTITLYADDFDLGSMDECGTGSLNFSFSNIVSDDFRTFTCAEIGTNALNFWVTDGNNNQNWVSVAVIIQDNINVCQGGVAGCRPGLVLEDDLVVALDANQTATVWASDFDAGSQDLCNSGGLTFSFSSDLADLSKTFTCAHLGQNSVQVGAIDNNGNQIVAQVSILVVDDLDMCSGGSGCTPGFVGLNGIAAGLPPSRQLSIPAAAFNKGSQDACASGGLSFDYAGNSVFDCDDLGVQSVSIGLTDDLGNTIQASSYIKIEDNTDACSGPGFAVAYDDCDPNPINVTYSDATATGTCPATEIITRTWSATDVSGNTTTADQIITIEDTTDPLIECPGDQSETLDANCELALPDYTGLVTAGDDCVQVPGISQTPPAGTMITGNTSVTITATDACGNTADCSFMVLVSDGDDPEVTCPGNQLGALDTNCEFVIPDYTSLVAADDNCDTGLDLDQVPAPGTIVSITTAVTITATDDAGNDASCSFAVELNSSGPVFSATPGNITVYCESDVPGDQGIIANDDCDGQVQVFFSQTGLPLSCPGSGTVTNTWTASDSHGNTTTHTQTIAVVDDVKPALSAEPASITVDCSADVPGDQGVTATDNCGESLTVIFTQSDLPSCAGSGTVTNMWVAQDCSGNSVVYTQTVTIDDPTGPVFSATPGDVTVDCIADVPGDQGITANDNCDGSVTVSFSQSTLPDCNGSGLVTNTWTASDCAGNTSSYTQTVTIDDGTPPTLSNTFPDITVSCVADVPGDQGVTATDNCDGTVAVVFDQSDLPTCAGEGTVVNTWTATDCAGNSVVYKQTITIDDNTDPVFSATPDNILVSCAADVPGDPGITATDNCGETITVEFYQTGLPLACAGNGTVTNTWVATDCAGNTASYTQTIIVQDDDDPVLSATPGDLLVSCLSDVPGDPGITATDNCGETLNVIYTQSPLPACEGVGTVINTWTVVDCSGNSTTHIQTITIADTDAPVLSAEPGDMTVTCSADVPGDPGITATDNCGALVDVVFSQTGLPLACSGSGTVVNTWTVVDCVGNSTVHTQTITVEDDVDPQFSHLPSDVIVDCESDVLADQGVTATDNCGEALTVTFTQTGLPLSFPDPAPVVNTWTTTDCAGNSISYSQTVTVKDDIDPVANCKNITVVLDGSGSKSILPDAIDNNSSDNCGITNLVLDITNFDCDDVGVNPVVLTAVDDFGNSNSCLGFVSVIASAICPPPAIAYAGGPNISDPCTCRGNGAFDEEVVVGPTGEGQSWSVVSTTLLDPNTLMPILPGTPLVESSVGGGQSVYSIQGVHLDGQGYTIDVASPSYPGEILTISNTCYYPDPMIVNVDGPYCLNTPPFILEGDVGGVALDAESFTINGVPGNIFDPADLGIGTHLIVYTVDAGTAGPEDPADPGCVASVSTTAQVIETNDVVACNNALQVSVNSDCEAFIHPDLILEGNYGCYDDYAVSVHLGPNSIPNPVPGTYIGQTLTVTVEHLVSGNSCWGTITLEDKLKPVFDCPTAPVQIACTEDYTLIPPPVATDNCTPVSYQLVGEVTVDDDACDDNTVRIERTWIAIDDYGNESLPCVQTIEIIRPDNVDFPNDILWECDQYDLYPTITGAVALHPAIKNLETGTDPIDATQVFNPNLLNNTGSGIPLDIDGAFCSYNYSHSDLVIPTCGTSFQIVRTWTVLDWCTGQVVTSNNEGEDNVQLITIDDITPPVVIRGPFNVSANIYGQHPNPCTSQDFLLPPAVTDNCNTWEVKIFTPVGEATYANGVDGSQGGFIPAPGLGLGVHIITYQVTDDCGNVNNFPVQVTVIDDISPVAICDEITEVGLTSNGQAVVSASVFDDGSFDNCCVDEFLVRRMDDNCDIAGNETFGPSVIFCCEDIALSPILVQFRVVDCFGNFNECMVQVYVEDQLQPITAQCPGPQTIDCEFYLDELGSALATGDYSVLDQFGNPLFYDNCEFEVDTTVVVDLNTCQEGTITRTWVASDPSGNTPASCVQTITVEHVSNFVVEFPEDQTANCVAGELPEFGEPEIFFDECELVGVSFDDMEFYVVPDACYKIVRTWEVINWCLYDEYGDDVFEEFSELQVQQDFDGDGDFDTRTFKDGVNGGPGPDGYITYVQTIKIVDDEAPQFTVADLEVCIVDTDCGADVTIPLPMVTDCSENITINVTSTMPNGSGEGPYMNVPPGSYSAQYEVSDNCGNTVYKTIGITVEDCKLPTPVCVEGLVVEIMQTGMISTMPGMYDAGSYDNCPGDLQLSFSSNVNDTILNFTCADLGLNPIELWVTDANGNQDFCATELEIQDNMGVCDTVTIIVVSGAVAREDNMPIEGVMMDVNSGEYAMMTDANGQYSFDMEAGSDYTITPQHDVGLLNGVTTLDMVFIQKHILGILPLGSPYKMIAADANNSGLVTTVDMVHIQKAILFLTDEFPNNTSWRFVDADYVFPNPEDPWEEPFPEVISFNNLDQDEYFADFVAIKVGDVNLTAQAQGDIEDRQTQGTMHVVTNEHRLEAGKTYYLPFEVEATALQGFQFTFDFDPALLDVQEVLPGVAEAKDFGLAKLDEGAITFSWHQVDPKKFREGERLFMLKVKAKEDGLLSEAIQISSRFTPAEAYNANLDYLKVGLKYKLDIPKSADPILYQNRPNPFQDQTYIGFYLPETTDIVLTIYDVTGNILLVIQGTYEAGYNELEISNINGSGLLYYRLDTPEFSAVRKMIALD